MTGTRRATRRRRSSAGLVATLLLATAAIVAAAVAWPTLQPLLRQANRPAKRRAVAAAQPQPAVVEPVVQRKPEPVSKPRPEPKPTPQPDPAPAPAPDPAPAPVMDPPPAVPPAPVAADTPGPMREPDGDEDATRAADEVARDITTAAAALRGHDLAAAEAALEAAHAAADGAADLETRVNRWRLLVAYARQLDEHLAKAEASANEGRDYTIGDRTIAIVELGPQTYAYKERGKVTRGPRAELPRVVERAVLAGWFDGDPQPANGIFVGLHRLLDAKPDLDRVRAAWEEAAAGDPAAASILPLLEDPALVADR